jgi:60 kDa SS-A/Ro ribonucleoprotein
MDYARHAHARQTEPLDSRQVENHAGGYTYQVTPWERLERFLVLGTEGGTYYQAEREITRENARVVEDLISEDGPRLVEVVRDFSVENRAPRVDPLLFALALAQAKGDAPTRAAIRGHFNAIVRTGYHLFRFVHYADSLRGFGRSLKTLIRGWYASKSPEDLTYQVLKYPSRGGWSHRDLLRLTHPKNEKLNAVFALACGKFDFNFCDLPFVGEIALLKKAKAPAAATIIKKAGLVREMIPTELLKSTAVWEALLDKMPMGALIRNLSNLSRRGVIGPGRFEANALVASRICNPELLHRARIHPIAVLMARAVYAAGRGLRSRGEGWMPDGSIISALDAAFPLAFKNVEPTGKRILLALDVSGSMACGQIAGTMLTPREASAALALVTVKTEKNVGVMSFQDRFLPLAIGASDNLASAVGKVSRLPFGGTDCALPMIWALKEEIPIDLFVIYTDSETWSGAKHPPVALRDYRRLMGVNAKLCVVGMTATDFTIADPQDPGMLDVVGFDANVPKIMADFAG